MRARLRPWARMSIIGRTKPAVLPVPVWAMPMMSRPIRTDGMRLALDRRRLVIAALRHGAEQFVGKAEIGKGHGRSGVWAAHFGAGASPSRLCEAARACQGIVRGRSCVSLKSGFDENRRPARSVLSYWSIVGYDFRCRGDQAGLSVASIQALGMRSNRRGDHSSIGYFFLVRPRGFGAGVIASILARTRANTASAATLGPLARPRAISARSASSRRLASGVGGFEPSGRRSVKAAPAATSGSGRSCIRRRRASGSNRGRRRSGRRASG